MVKQILEEPKELIQNEWKEKLLFNGVPFPGAREGQYCNICVTGIVVMSKCREIGQTI